MEAGMWHLLMKISKAFDSTVYFRMDGGGEGAEKITVSLGLQKYMASEQSERFCGTNLPVRHNFGIWVSGFAIVSTKYVAL